jgi:hypothetical protein
MTKASRALRASAVVAMGGAAAFAGAGTATAAPIDVQPIPLMCASGIAPVQSVTHDEQPAVEPEEILYLVNEPGGSGATVSWININTGLTGSDVLAEKGGPFGTPGVIAEPEAGTVLSAVWGLHENVKGEQCFLLPGLDMAQVPAEPGDPD